MVEFFCRRNGCNVRHIGDERMNNDNFKALVNSGNVEEVRKELLSILNANPDLGDGEFLTCYNYAKTNLGEALFDENSDFEIKTDRTQWTTSYVAKIFLALRKSFSKQIVNHLLEVAPYAYKDKAVQRDLQRQTHERTRNQTESQKSEKIKYLTTGVCLVVAFVIIVLILKLF